ncbi:MAG: hypothetical protein AAB853_00350 [Patescibacteria group bacterium]
MKQRKKFSSMPRRVSKRILDHGTHNGEPVVLVFREGKPSRVFALHAYLKMQEHPTIVQPWKHRKDRTKEQPDPLGAVDMGTISLPMTREHLYE